MMIMMKRSRQSTAVTSQVRELGPNLSFLDVVRDTCRRDGRYTLDVVGPDVAFTVLVDRGGPFNAIGGGTAGSAALVRAAQLRSGRCTISIGWPVEQPVYQPGLDMTLKGLVEGVVEPQGLPRHRGVDSLRNAEWREAPVAPPVPEAPRPVGLSDAPYAAAPVRQPLMPTPPARPRPAPEAANPVAAPVPAPAPAPEPRMVWKQVGSRDVWTTETELPVSFKEPTPGQPALEGAKERAKKLATKGLLWLVEADEPGEVTFEEAAAMARRGLVDGVRDGVSSAFHPFKKDLGKRVDRIREDWEKSGQVAARARRKQAARKAAAQDVDPDAEFRL